LFFSVGGGDEENLFVFETGFHLTRIVVQFRRYPLDSRTPDEFESKKKPGFHRALVNQFNYVRD
jgi:hypothetical protein